MKIDWAALGVVAVVSVAMTLVFVLLLASGIRFLSAGPVRSGTGTSGVPVRAPARRPIGYIFLGLAGLLVLLGIYLIMPFSR